jgi:hypothetical protein
MENIRTAGLDDIMIIPGLSVATVITEHFTNIVSSFHYYSKL